MHYSLTLTDVPKSKKMKTIRVLRRHGVNYGIGFMAKLVSNLPSLVKEHMDEEKAMKIMADLEEIKVGYSIDIERTMVWK